MTTSGPLLYDVSDTNYVREKCDAVIRKENAKQKMRDVKSKI